MNSAITSSPPDAVRMQPNDYYGGFKKEPSRRFQVHCTVIANTWYQDVCWKRICKAWSLLNGRFYSLQGRSQPIDL